MTPVALLWLAMKRTGNLFAACAFPVEGLPVAGPVGFAFAFDGVVGDFAFVFGGDERTGLSGACGNGRLISSFRRYAVGVPTLLCRQDGRHPRLRQCLSLRPRQAWYSLDFSA